MTSEDDHAHDNPSSNRYEDQDDRHDDITQSIFRYFSGADSGDTTIKTTDSNARPQQDESRRRANVQLPPGWGKTQLALRSLANFYPSLLLHSDPDA